MYTYITAVLYPLLSNYDVSEPHQLNGTRRPPGQSFWGWAGETWAMAWGVFFYFSGILFYSPEISLGR